MVSKDVQKYVEYAKGLEVKVEELKVKAKASKQEEIQTVKTIDDSILCQTCVIDDDNNDNHLQNIADKVEKIAVSIQHRNEEIVQEIKLSKIHFLNRYLRTRTGARQKAKNWIFSKTTFYVIFK